mmetsp:Transcript_17123/g.25657  ORF Transcript_17123/g.25657 Transcript_17123/m.25657 type:complete len:155 (-) Transcript_17123:230-694(-)
MIKKTRGYFQPQTGSQIACSCSNNNHTSRRIDRYLVEMRRGTHSSSTQPYLCSEPIHCPPSLPPDDKCCEQQMSIEQSTEYYNARTWNMYYRIVKHCRQEQGDNKSSCSASFLLSSRRNTSCSSVEKASSSPRGAEESLGNSNSCPEEIFQLEL